MPGEPRATEHRVKSVKSSLSFISVTILSCMTTTIHAQDLTEAWVNEPMPVGIQIISTEIAGPTFADADGRTFYVWPLKAMRAGITGDAPGKSDCKNEKLILTAGLMSPYPPGLALPNAETRPTCTDIWPPVLAAENAQEVGNWSIIQRDDATQQWAYKDQAVYTYTRDPAPGDVFGTDIQEESGSLDRPAYRRSIGPMSLTPPGFAVAPRVMGMGRTLTTDEGWSIYVNEQDTEESTICHDECTLTWVPILSPALAIPQGEWGMFERSPGEYQWTFRSKPLYRYEPDPKTQGVEGADVPGWSNVYTQKAPAYPESFTVQTGFVGDVLGDSRGRTIYTYNCTEDTFDQLRCDHPDDTQVYRKAMCGAGDQGKCLENWLYVEAMPGEASRSRSWSIVSIDTGTGHYATPDQQNSIRVWAWRGRPVYTFSDDQQPGDTYGSDVGEVRGQKNGLQAFILRNYF
jgi:predicted lipoprotein with Yx(FWY)xxD motif